LPFSDQVRPVCKRKINLVV